MARRKIQLWRIYGSMIADPKRVRSRGENAHNVAYRRFGFGRSAHDRNAALVAALDRYRRRRRPHVDIVDG